MMGAVHFLINVVSGIADTIRALSIVRTDRSDCSRRDDNFTLNQNFPATSVK